MSDKEPANKLCPKCGRVFTRAEKPWATTRKWERTRYCSRACAIADSRGDPVARFWAYVDRRGEADCWFWTGSRDAKGYGLHWIGKSFERAHRFTLELDGRPLKEGEFALHSCDHPACVNPRHLRAGSYLDNAQDRVARGRSRHAKGENHRCARLTEKQVREMRSSPLSDRDWSDATGVSVGAIYGARRGLTWRHL